MRNIILALVGLPAAGKSTVAQVLQRQFNFNWVRTRDIVRTFASDESITSLQSMGANLSWGSGADAFCKELFNRLDPNGPNVIDAIRPKEHWRRIQDGYGSRVHLVSVTASRSLRQRRFLADNRSGSIELRDEHEVEIDVPILMEESTFTIVNQDHLDFRVRQLVDFIDHISESNRQE